MVVLNRWGRHRASSGSAMVVAVGCKKGGVAWTVASVAGQDRGGLEVCMCFPLEK